MVFNPEVTTYLFTGIRYSMNKPIKPMVYAKSIDIKVYTNYCFFVLGDLF